MFFFQELLSGLRHLIAEFFLILMEIKLFKKMGFHDFWIVLLFKCYEYLFNFELLSLFINLKTLKISSRSRELFCHSISERTGSLGSISKRGNIRNLILGCTWTSHRCTHGTEEIFPLKTLYTIFRRFNMCMNGSKFTVKILKWGFISTFW